MRLAALVAAAVVLAGCGDDPLTRAEFDRRANAICRETYREVQGAFDRLPDGASEAQVRRTVLDDLLPAVSRELDRIRALDPPASRRTAVTEALDGAERDVRTVRSSLDALLLGGADPFAATNDKLHAIGLSDCGQVPPTR